MRLVRLDTSLGPTLDLGLRFRRAKGVPVGQPKPNQRRRPSFAAWTSQIGAGHGVKFRPARGTAHGEDFPHGLRVSTARSFVLTCVHDGLKAKGGGHADGDAFCIRQGHQSLNGGPTCSGPEPETKRSISTAQARGSKHQGNNRQRQRPPPQPTHQQHTGSQVRLKPHGSRMRCKAEVEALGPAQNQHRQPRKEVAQQDANRDPNNDAQQRHVTSTPKPTKGAFEEVHAASDVLAANGVGKAQVTFTARPKGRAR